MWGEARYGTLPTGYQYTSQYHEDYIELYWYNSRWYDPALGRFAQADTIIPDATQGVQAWDRFAYVNNNPVRFSDASGSCIGPASMLLPYCILAGIAIVAETKIALMEAEKNPFIPNKPEPTPYPTTTPLISSTSTISTAPSETPFPSPTLMPYPTLKPFTSDDIYGYAEKIFDFLFEPGPPPDVKDLLPGRMPQAQWIIYIEVIGSTGYVLKEIMKNQSPPSKFTPEQYLTPTPSATPQPSPTIHPSSTPTPFSPTPTRYPSLTPLSKLELTP